MTNVKQELDQALFQLRSLNAAMNRSLAELEAAGVWSGSDATAFQTEWANEVQRALTISASALDAVSYAPAS